jgi:hypothetical protein
MKMTRIAQVKSFNRLVKYAGMSRMYVMTTGSGAMYEPERVKGWVLFQSPKLGDQHDFAKWYPSRQLAEFHREAMA